jgi:hypothetical protein
MAFSRSQIVQIAKRTGYPVVEAWSGNNAGTMGTIMGPLLHHTGTPESVGGDYPTLKVVRDGRPNLENSLAMYGIGRSGTIYCINDKISWHAGVGDWNGITDGNGHFAGIEAEGPYNTWPAAELDAYEKLVASILIEVGRGLDWAPTHAQFANPPGRKTDPQGFDLVRFRNNVQRYLNNPALLGQKEDDFDMDKATFLSWAREALASTPAGTSAGGAGPADLSTYVKSTFDLVNKLNDRVKALEAAKPGAVDVKALASEILKQLANPAA